MPDTDRRKIRETAVKNLNAIAALHGVDKIASRAQHDKVDPWLGIQCRQNAAYMRNTAMN